ncbi:Caspase domain-containing protein [Streptomyces sp. cf386]|uniref:caspase family protein n=1 Tax=Streptomyces sp. cf386 TaxID=1761904 RepID=UPI00087EC972|nr:caspase family protein [Streptomyces sp. cf386]SDP82174.1 Caspase domain-containing protein [Streptomyces sp. cf386]
MTGSRHALIIANDDYQNAGLKQLVAPAEDAMALATVLADPKIGEFEVQVSRNEPRHEIERKINDFFAERRPGDALILHFSCHGLKSESGELFFAATDTVPGRLISTAVASDFVRKCMADSRARSIVLFLDCCYGGAFSRGMTMRAGEEVHVLEAFSESKFGRGRGWAVITASNSMQYAFEGTQLSGEFGTPRPSVFTGALVHGLTTGDADRDEDGLVSLDELYDYVYDRVRQENPRQTPSRTINLQGDLYLAHSSRKKIKPMQPPDDLREAISSPDVFSRRGAIAELRSRMASTHLEKAAGAREALVQMSQRDIQWVADEASAALRDVKLIPDPSKLYFGTLAQESTSPNMEVRLTGPPLAQHCDEVRPQDDRIIVVRTETGFAVTVDTSQAGLLHGHIALKGPVGEATLQVDAEITPKTTAEHVATEGTPSRTEPIPEIRPDVKRALILSSCTLLAGVATVLCILQSILSIYYVGTDIATSTEQGITFDKAVTATAADVSILTMSAVLAAVAALATLMVGRFARRAVAAVATVGSGKPRPSSLMTYLMNSVRVVVAVAQFILPLALFFAIGSAILE